MREASIPGLSRLGYSLAGLLLLQVNNVVVGGDLPQGKLEDVTQAQWQTYGDQVAQETAGFGIALSFIIGLLMVILSIVFCCRCCKLRQADRDIEDGKGFNFDQQDMADRARSHCKILWVGTLAVFLIYTASAGMAYKETQQTQVFFDNSFKGTDTFLTDVQNALCTIDGANTCEQHSVGDFLYDMRDAATKVLDSVADWIFDLSLLLVPLTEVAGNSTDLVASYTTAAGSLTNAVAARNRVTAVEGNSDYSRYAFTLPNKPTITSSYATVLNGTLTSLQSLSTTATSAKNTMNDSVASTASAPQKIRLQINSVHGDEASGDDDLRFLLTDTVASSVDEITKLTKQISDVQTGEVIDIHDIIYKYLQPASLGAAGVVFIPAAILLLMSMFGAVCHSPKPFYAYMTFIFILQGIYCILGGVFLTIHTINGDVCAAHLDLIETNLPEPITIMNKKTAVLGPAIIEVLQCTGKPGDQPNSSNNFVDIFGAGFLFDVSDPVGKVADQIEAVGPILIDQLSLIDTVNSTIGNFTLVMSQPNTTTMKGSYDYIAAGSTVYTKLQYLPTAPFMRDDATQQGKISTEYLDPSRPNHPTWVWSDYNNDYVAFKNYLGTIDSAMGSAGWHTYAEYASISLTPNITSLAGFQKSTYCGATSLFYDSGGNGISDLTSRQIYVDGTASSTNQAQLCTYADNLQTKTVDLDAFDLLNTGFVSALNQMMLDVYTMQDGIDDTVSAQTLAASTTPKWQTSLLNMKSIVTNSADDLDPLANTILNINDVAMTANQYAMCGFVGTFYTDVYKGAVCTDFQKSTLALATPLLVVAIVMFLSFILHGYYAPALRSRPAVVPFMDENSGKKGSGHRRLSSDHKVAPVLDGDYD